MGELSCDVLVVGGGLAGLAAALEARRAGADVVLLCKGRVGRSGNTILAACNLSGVFPGGGDSVEVFARDTLAGGKGIGDPELVRTLAAESAAAVDFLEEHGVPFQRDGASLLLKGIPGHCLPRTATAVDDGHRLATAGLSLTLPLLTAVRTAGVRFVENATALRLERGAGRVCGATALVRGGGLILARAGAVVLACGGGGRLYAGSNNTSDMTGDGLTLAHGAGAELRDLEFVQFHPTMGIVPVRAIFPTTLFADGAVLRNRAGERFLLQTVPAGEVEATRDAMSRAIFEEVAAGRGVGGGVLLDLSGVVAELAASRYRTLWRALADKGHDPGRDPVQVGVAAHFLMGGMTIDASGASTVPGLFGAGEVTGGVHGANRLGGNGLAEAAVFGRIAGRSAAGDAARRAPARPEGEALRLLPPPEGSEVMAEVRREVRALLWEEAGVLRTGERLARGLARWESAQARFASLPEGAGGEWFQVRSLLIASRLLLEAAKVRTESRGAHQRMDYPEPDDGRWLGSIRIRPDAAGQPELVFTPAGAGS